MLMVAYPEPSHHPDLAVIPCSSRQHVVLELSKSLELFLNLAGVCVALALVCLWLWGTRTGCAPGGNRATQFIAMALLILIIFPIISVTDDLLAAEKVAETDSLLRRGHELAGTHAAIPLAACPGEAALLLQPRMKWHRIAALVLPHRVPSEPALAPIENRPPPNA